MYLRCTSIHLSKERNLYKMIHEIIENVPIGYLQSNFYHLFGSGVLSKMFLSTSGLGIASRISFLRYCRDTSPTYYNFIAKFCDSYFKLLHCKHVEVGFIQLSILILSYFNNCFVK